MAGPITTNVRTPGEDDAFVILHLIASGLIDLAERVRDGKPIRLPYPAPLQRGFDKLTLLCLRGDAEPPSSVPDLLKWCHRPLTSWPLPFPGDVIGEFDTLLIDGMPSQVCQEWAVNSSDVEAEVLERRLLGEVLATCRTASAPETYVAFRRLLIEEPVLTALELQLHAASSNFALITDFLRLAYTPAPAECIVDGSLHTCATCRNLLVRNADGELRCGEDRCRRAVRPRIGRTLSQKEGVLWLRRELRTFIAAPGRTELRLAEMLSQRGVEVELWPAYDAYDLLVRFPDGNAWAVDVKDWANPFLLARHVRPIPQAPPWSRAFFVFPQDRLRRRDYLRAFRHYCPILGGDPPVDAAMEREFLALVENRLKGGCSA